MADPVPDAPRVSFVKILGRLALTLVPVGMGLLLLGLAFGGWQRANDVDEQMMALAMITVSCGVCCGAVWFAVMVWRGELP